MAFAKSGCECESLADETVADHDQYSHDIGEIFGICVYNDARDIIAFVAICIHLLAWILLFLPQMRLNYIHKSAANLSLLYLSFWFFSEACFLISTVLERWSWLWISHRIWRTLLSGLLLAQSVWYKFGKRNEFSAAIEAPFARHQPAVGGAIGRDGYFQFDEDEDQHMSMSWPARSTNSPTAQRGAINKSSTYGVTSQAWGHALLSEGGGGTAPPPPSRLGGANEVSSSPARSRLPPSHAHLSSVMAPRTISPSQTPVIATHQRVASSRTGGNTHDSALSSSYHQINMAAGSYNPPLNAFQPSPTSAFHPVLQVEPMDNLTVNGGGGGGGGGVGSMGRPATFILIVCIIGLSMWSQMAPRPSYERANIETDHRVGAPSRSLLSIDAMNKDQPPQPFYGHLDVTLLPSLISASVEERLHADLFNVSSTPSICNYPYHPSSPTEVFIRIFGWLGCACGALAFFPQFIYNDSMKSVNGLSFVMYGMMLVGNMALVIGMCLPSHNDWLDNRYTNKNGAFADWYLSQVILPILIVHAFNFLQIWVLVVQRARFKKPQIRHF